MYCVLFVKAKKKKYLNCVTFLSYFVAWLLLRVWLICVDDNDEDDVIFLLFDDLPFFPSLTVFHIFVLLNSSVILIDVWGIFPLVNVNCGLPGYSGGGSYYVINN